MSTHHLVPACSAPQGGVTQLWLLLVVGWPSVTRCPGVASWGTGWNEDAAGLDPAPLPCAQPCCCAWKVMLACGTVSPEGGLGWRSAGGSVVLDIEGYIYLVASVQCGSGRTGSLPACVERYFCYMSNLPSLQGWDTSELAGCAGTSCFMGNAGPAASVLPSHLQRWSGQPVSAWG